MGLLDFFREPKRKEPLIWRMAREGIELAEIPDIGFMESLSTDLSVFQPILLTFDREPDCLYPGQGRMPYRGQEAAKDLLTLELTTLGRVHSRIKTLLTGSAGTGKTTLAHIIMKMIGERQEDLGYESGPVFELMPAQVREKALLDQFMTTVARHPHAKVFIDEVHDLQNLEALFRVLQDGDDLWYPLSDGQRLPVPGTISWIAATTDPGKLDSTTGGAMRRRMEPEIRLEEPDTEDLAHIIRDAGEQDFREVHPDAAYEIAERSLYPWQAKLLYSTALKVAESEESDMIAPAHAHRAFKLRDVDKNGLLKEDRAVIRALLGANGGKGIPVGSGKNREYVFKLSEQNVCSIAGVDQETYRKRVQPKLARLGLLTTRGAQCLTDLAVEKYKHLRIPSAS